jgi:hypothetical protein
VRFVFSVTNHTAGKPESFGFADETTTIFMSPRAIEAPLAASSFPLAFRRRTREEIFGRPRQAPPGDLYADGGIFDNFPSDTGFSYLREITRLPETAWIGERFHQIYLLSLTSPTTMEGDVPREDGVVWNFWRGMGQSDDEKVLKTLRGQLHRNVLAAKANPILREEGKPQAIRGETILITPAYGIYDHPFAFKSYLGFTADKQQEMLASGCPRARLAMEWSRDPERSRGPVRLPLFIEALEDEVKRVKSLFSSDPEGTCLFGRFTPDKRATPCPFFADDPGGRAVFERCKATIDRELSLQDLKLPVDAPA